MVLLVPFDGSELSELALIRADEFGTVYDERVLAVSVIPQGNVAYARDRDWLPPGEDYDVEMVVSVLQEQVVDLAPTAEFRHVLVDRYAPSGTISNRLRRMAREEDPSMTFIGSENAGHIVSAFSSVGTRVATADAYDVVIVRNRRSGILADRRSDSEPDA
jgi:nucleotide-binding universal stress UspA family protein